MSLPVNRCTTWDKLTFCLCFFIFKAGTNNSTYFTRLLCWSNELILANFLEDTCPIAILWEMITDVSMVSKWGYCHCQHGAETSVKNVTVTSSPVKNVTARYSMLPVITVGKNSLKNWYFKWSLIQQMTLILPFFKTVYYKHFDFPFCIGCQWLFPCSLDLDAVY